MKKPDRYWVVLNASTGKPILFDGRVPVYWRRRVAEHDANNHGFTTSGSDRDVRICRCVLTPETAG